MLLNKDEYGDDVLVIEKEDDIYTLTQAIATLQRKAAPIATAMLALKGKGHKFYEDDIHFDDGEIYAEYKEGCCGCYETYRQYVQISYLFNDQWLEEATKKIEEQRQAEKLAAEAKARANKAKKQEQEYNKYLELQKKYGGGK